MFRLLLWTALFSLLACGQTESTHPSHDRGGEGLDVQADGGEGEESNTSNHNSSDDTDDGSGNGDDDDDGGGDDNDNGGNGDDDDDNDDDDNDDDDNDDDDDDDGGGDDNDDDGDDSCTLPEHCAVWPNSPDCFCADDSDLKTIFSGTPDEETSSAQATFSFYAFRYGAQFECSLDGEPWQPCSSPHTLTLSSFGQHSFSVRAIDGVEVESDPPVFTWNLQVRSYQSLSMDDFHACAVGQGGEVYCWGRNSYGELGEDPDESDFGDHAYEPQRIRYSASIPIEGQMVSAGDRKSCVITPSGSAMCWGRGRKGQLGYGGMTYGLHQPTLVAGDHTWAKIDAGRDAVCGITVEGDLYCWGDAEYGATGGEGDDECGDGDSIFTSDPCSKTPKYVSSGWVDLAVGEFYGCGIKEDAGLYCWGDLETGNLGMGEYTFEQCGLLPSGGPFCNKVPRYVAGGFAQVAVYRGHTCGVKLDGTLWCWGSNSYGQLGVEVAPDNCGNEENACAKAPIQIGTETNWHQVAVSNQNSCAVKTDGTLWCWGRNSVWQLPDPSATEYRTPKQIGSETDWSYVQTGHLGSCAMKTNGQILCFGARQDGILGSGPGADLCGGSRKLCSKSLTMLTPEKDWQSFSGGRYMRCAIDDDQSLWCWGWNEAGQLGLGDLAYRDSPTEVALGSQWQMVSAGMKQACGIQSDGTLWCWGALHEYSYGLGNGYTEGSTLPVQIGTDTNWLQVGAADNHKCGLKLDGTLWCWGNGWQPWTLGQGETALQNCSEPGPSDCGNMPQQVGTDTDWLLLDVARGIACAIKDDSSLWCWGRNDSGQIGLGYEGAQDADSEEFGGMTVALPTEVVSDIGWQSVVVTENVVCAVALDGSLWCWGGDDTLTDNGNNDYVWGPEPAPLYEEHNDYVELVESSSFSARKSFCARRQGGERVCFGYMAHSLSAAVDVMGGAQWMSFVSHRVSFGHNNYLCGLASNQKLYCQGYSSGGFLGTGWDYAEEPTLISQW